MSSEYPRMRSRRRARPPCDRKLRRLNGKKWLGKISPILCHRRRHHEGMSARLVPPHAAVVRLRVEMLCVGYRMVNTR